MKLASYFILINSSITAFCLALVAFMLATGELPFDLQPLLADDTSLPAAPGVREPPTEHRQQEASASELLASLEGQREELAVERAKLADQQAAATELINHAELLQTRMAKAQQDALALLDLIDDQEKANLQNMAKLLGSTDSKAASAIIAEMPVRQASRVLYYMNQRQSAELLTMMVTDPGKTKFAAELTLGMQRIAEEATVKAAIPTSGRTP